MADPKLTVLTTVFNGERYLDEAIKSILAQDFTDYEYLIVDDGSTDNTPQILRRWAERDPRIVVERIAQNAGIARALNRGLALARGKYVGRQDVPTTSRCRATRLRRQVDRLESEPDVVLVSANFTMIDDQGRWAGNCVVENPSAVIAYLLNFSNAVAGAGSQGMFRRDMARDLGGFREDYDVSVDYEFWTRLVQHGRFVILPFFGLKYRLHSQRSSVRHRNQQRRNSLASSLRMLTAHLNRALSDEEFTAAMSIWEHDGRTGVTSAGQRLLSEAYARFATEAEPQHRRRVRRITATRWFLSCVTLIRRGEFAEAARHLGCAFVWHPFGVGDGVALLAERVLVRFRRILS